MTLRSTLILAAAGTMAFAPTALGDHHGAKNKGHEKAMEKAHKANKANKANKTNKAREKSAEDLSETAKEHAEAARERSDEAREQAEEAGKGRGAEMRERRDERKEIMEGVKSDAEPGTPRKGKKPWWKFWGAEEEEASE